MKLFDIFKKLSGNTYEPTPSSAPSTEMQKTGYLPITAQQKFLYRIDVKEWRQAHSEAIDIYRPRRDKLIDIYTDAMLDTHLASKLQTRSLNVLNTPFRLMSTESEPDAEKTALIKKQWFYQVLQYIIEAKYYGYSVFFLIPENGEIRKTGLVPRENVIPELEAVLPNINVDDYVCITEPPYSDNYILVNQQSKDLGLLLECSRYAIFKKHAVAHWSQYQEVFGIPFRYAKTTSRDRKVLDDIFQNLKNMGAAGFGLFPEGTDIHFLESAKSDPYNVFLEAIKMANQEITNRVLGTGQADSTEGSFAREKVSYEMQSDINYADLRFVESVINDQVIPLLNLHGYGLEGLSFAFDLSFKIPLANNQLEVDRFLLENFDIPEEYFRTTYGVPVEKKKLIPQPSPAQKGQLKQAIEALYYADECTHTPIIAQEEFEIDYLGWMGGIEQFLRDIHRGKVKPEELNETLFFERLRAYQSAVEQGTGQSWLTLNFDTPNYALYAQMRQNVYYFNAAATYSQLKEMQDLLFQDGKPVPFELFRTRIDNYRRQAEQISEIYNKTWLKTEYNFALNQSEANRRWAEFEDQADLYPYLEYRAVKDERTRASHELLNGVRLPLNDPFWDTYAPLNGWNCRCRLIQSQEPPAEGQELPSISTDEVSNQFRNNQAKTGGIFKDTHPFFQEQGKFNKTIRDRANEFFYQENARINRKIYDDFKDDNFTKVSFDEQSGGYLIQEKGSEIKQRKENGYSELDAVNLLVSEGWRVLWRKVSTEEYVRTSDIYLNDAKVDIKIKAGSKRSIQEAAKSAISQANSLVLLINTFEIDAVTEGLINAFKSHTALNLIHLYTGKGFKTITRKDFEGNRIREVLK